MARKKAASAAVTPEEMAEAVSEDTAQIELEKLQKKIAREERKKRREIEASKQKQAKWLLPLLLFASMLVTWVLSQLQFQVEAPADEPRVEEKGEKPAEEAEPQD